MAKCYGCGIKLQYEDENKAGYVPFEVINSSDKIYCKRCFQIIHNGKKYVSCCRSNGQAHRCGRRISAYKAWRAGNRYCPWGPNKLWQGPLPRCR